MPDPEFCPTLYGLFHVKHRLEPWELVSRETPSRVEPLELVSRETYQIGKTYLPTQNSRKMTSRMSSTSTRPNNRPRDWAAILNSSAASSSPCSTTWTQRRSEAAVSCKSLRWRVRPIIPASLPPK